MGVTIISRHSQPLVFGSDIVFGALPGGAAAGNGLLNNLIAYWPGNEAAGNALDLHTNALHLTDTNTVTSNPGLVYALARQYTAVNNEMHVRPGDDALLSTGDVDFTLAAWCRFDTFGVNRYIAGKSIVATTYEYWIQYGLAANRLQFVVSSDGTALATVEANTLGAPAINVWYLVVGIHDSVANTISVGVNDVFDSAIYALGVFNGAVPFRIGWRAATAEMDGRIGPTMFWKSNAGLGGALDAAKRTALFNGGAGLTYAAFTV